jgi:YfiH family protein
VTVAFTDRRGGVSAPPYDELNLAVAGGDAPEARAANLRRVLADFAPGATAGPTMRQVHGGDASVVSAASVGAGEQECDGQVTDLPDTVLAVRVADCVPVLLADPAARVVGVAHAGRLGVVRGVVGATVARMRDLGATTVTAWVGPHICGGCYEVPAAMQDEVAAIEPATRAVTTWGTASLDLGAGVRAQLERAEVTVVDVARCTRESDDLYSYRRDGDAAGRSAGLIRIEGHR